YVVWLSAVPLSVGALHPEVWFRPGVAWTSLWDSFLVCVVPVLGGGVLFYLALMMARLLLRDVSFPLPWATWLEKRAGRLLKGGWATALLCLGAGLVVALLGSVLSWYGVCKPSGTDVLWFVRVTNPLNGVSPLGAVLCLTGGLCAWAFCHLKRVYLLDRHGLSCPYTLLPLDRDKGNAELALLQRIQDQDAALRTTLADPKTSLLNPQGAVCLLLLALTLLWLALAFGTTFEGSAFAGVVEGGFALLTFALVTTFLQMLHLWGQVSRLLRPLALLPMATAYDRLPRSTSALFRGYLSSLRPN